MATLILEKLHRYEFVIWDWNGTLINDSHIAAAAETELFRAYGLKAQTPEERIKNFCFPIETYYSKMGFDFSKHPYEKVSEEWLAIYKRLISEARLFEGAFEMLKEIKESGKRQFILSAAPEDHVKEMALKHNVHDFLEAIYALSHAKADSKIERGAELIKDHKIDASKAILIGDTSHDFEVGEALGTDVLLVADGHHAFEVLEAIHNNVLRSRYPSASF